jgi:dTDP-glucose pyrophosphorylase
LKTLILTAGKIDYTRLPFGMHQSNATIPVNGKPVISWILDDLIQKNYTEIAIVVRNENTRLKQLLQKHYSKRIKLDIISLNNPTSILDSLQAGLTNNTVNDTIQVILGDTLIYDSFEHMQDSLFVAEVKSSENWCVVKTNNEGSLIELIDKKELPGEIHTALCGYYQFSNAKTLLNCVQNCMKQGSKELSAVLMQYHAKHPLSLKKVDTWFDFGHLESFVQSKKSLLRPRHFNQLTIDPLINTITKVSEKSDKLADELNWYLELPEKLKTLTPRIITQEQQNNKVTITQEFYGYPSLSELFVYGDLSTSVWESIIDYLFQIHGLFKQYEIPASRVNLIDMYEIKTQERINQMLEQDNFWKEIWNKEYITINGIVHLNIQPCLQKLNSDIQQLTKISTFNIIHGDYCLSNILYDLNNQIVRMIDPRGRFGEKGIYGDARYDIAKLRHSLVGLYDYIVGDLFQINTTENGFEYELFEDDKNKQLALYTDKCIKVNGYNLHEIKLIEGLLFLSMIPYHADYRERQHMMYVKSIQILNELIEKN